MGHFGYCFQGDHHAAFMWNGVNYLLKMPSDLDFLSQYRAIRSWLGFKIIRNPFCVPYPLEDGVPMFSGMFIIESSDTAPVNYGYGNVNMDFDM